MIAADTEVQARASGAKDTADDEGERSHAEVVLSRMGSHVEAIDGAIHRHISQHGAELLGGAERLVELRGAEARRRGHAQREREPLALARDEPRRGRCGRRGRGAAAPVPKSRAADLSE